MTSVLPANSLHPAARTHCPGRSETGPLVRAAAGSALGDPLVVVRVHVHVRVVGGCVYSGGTSSTSPRARARVQPSLVEPPRPASTFVHAPVPWSQTSPSGPRSSTGHRHHVVVARRPALTAACANDRSVSSPPQSVSGSVVVVIPAVLPSLFLATQTEFSRYWSAPHTGAHVPLCWLMLWLAPLSSRKLSPQALHWRVWHPHAGPWLSSPHDVHSCPAPGVTVTQPHVIVALVLIW